MNQTHPASAQSNLVNGAAQALDEHFHAVLTKASMGLSPISLALAYADWVMHLSVSPGRQMVMVQKLAELPRALGALWQPSLEPDATDKTAAVFSEPDARFVDPGWQQWPFNVLRQSFKVSESWWRDAAHVDGMSAHHRHVVSFFNGQALDAMSPSNWALTNPQVLDRALNSWGQSLLKGVQNFMQDAFTQHERRHGGQAAMKPLPFRVGQDVAVTPGKVVFRNHLIELIQYAPTTQTVFQEPILMVPSTIMKFYILDLSPENSMVRYLVGQGYTVFMMSWLNPDASDRHLGMQDYLETGVMSAMGAVKGLTGTPRIHALGYCLGGTFLAIVAAALGRCQARAHGKKGLTKKVTSEEAPLRRKDDAACLEAMPELATVSLLAAQTDFSEPGELGVFIDDDQLKTLRVSMARTGYLSGSQMAGSFQFLNSRDLVWSRNTRRYLLGEDEVGNDMMSWNADLTRLPERMHNEYLSSLFLNNALADGQYRISGEGVALRDIRAPMLVVGTVRDHVSPWRSVYKIHLHSQTQTTFILVAGGHNAGIVSEPGRPRRSYRMRQVPKGHGWIEPDEWLTQAPLFEGSWWPAMHEWLKERSGPMVPARAIDPACVLGDAPGDYVKVRYAD